MWKVFFLNSENNVNDGRFVRCIDGNLLKLKKHDSGSGNIISWIDNRWCGSEN